MSALLQPIDSFMPRADFHVQIDEQLKARVEALASRLTVDMNELVEFLVKRWVERTDPDEPNVTIHEVLMERQEDNAVKAALRGDTVPHDEVIAKFDQLLEHGREDGGRSPSSSSGSGTRRN
ncbi:hypothetical protein [Mitsuaria sp. GD03876]|uniref:hypothetical protein n=1 Tax=Mitsuaria sp. GD03876 TaxID=2975399 RepID=UPI002447934F|nr:hypothetical protein [Mitsuaria sp. GD03876]MDH0864354.1 hypothetical protein [Mitsuaria sp. GD03876]